MPESPRWLFIHGREQEAEHLVDSAERVVQAETGEQLSDVDENLTIHQRRSIGFGRIARTLVRRYARRTVLGLALFVGQAFYAIGTAVGGVSGPLIFAELVGTGKVGDTVLAFVTGVMIACGLVELWLGVKAERQGLESLATPLSAEGVEETATT